MSVLPGLLCVTVIFCTCIQISVCTIEGSCNETSNNCTVTNSYCDSTTWTCKCNDTFYEASATECVSKIALGATCTPSTDVCLDSNAECTGDTPKCSCKQGYYISSSSCVAKIALGATCTPSTDVCLDSNAECTGDAPKCSCKLGYYISSSSSSCVAKIALGATCTPSTDVCLDSNAECTGDAPKCSCNLGYYISSSSSSCVAKIALGATCTPSTDVCLDSNAECTGDTPKCSCKQGYYISSSSCVPKIALGATCTPSTDVCLDSNAQCTGDAPKCSCKQGYYISSSSSSCVAKIALGDTCTPSTDVCLDSNAECTGDTPKCSCKLGYYISSSSSSCVAKIALGATCTPSTDVCLDSNAQCTGDAPKCSCKQGYYISSSSSSSSCVAKIALGATCTASDVCLDSNAECPGDTLKCSCKPGYYISSSSCVPKIALGATCTTSTDVCLDSNAECPGDTLKCSCKQGYYISSSSCVPKIALGATCTTSTDVCLDSNAQCTGDTPKCSCKQGYYISSSSCVPKIALGATCTASDVCLDSNAECPGDTLKCSCKPGYYISSSSCVPKIALGATCTVSTDVCVDSNAECTGDTLTCSCKKTFFKSGSSCVLMSSIKPMNIRFSNTNREDTTVTWEQHHDFSDITGYEVSWTPNDGLNNENKAARSSDIINLIPGVNYRVTVSTVITQNGITQKINNFATVKTKQSLGGSCLTTTDCGDQYFAECFTIGICWCKTGRYRNDDGNCHFVSELTPKSVDVSVTGCNTLHVVWTTASGYDQYVTRYDIEWTPGDGSKSVSNTSNTTDIQDLTSGQLYAVTVKAVIIQEGNQQSADKTADSQRTIPDTPGPYDASLSNRTVPDIELHFTKSIGIVDHYIVTLTGVSDTSYVETYTIAATTQPHQIFHNIVAGHYYNLRIIALSFSVQSKPYIYTNIRGSVKAPSRVSQLTVSDIKYNSMSVKWKMPANPNGVMCAYILLLRLEENQNCQQKIVFRCSDCPDMTIVDSDRQCGGVTSTIINTSKTDLNNNNVEFSYKLTGLVPFKTYTIDVFAYIELDSGPTETLNPTTATKEAASPTMVSGSAVTHSSIQVKWKPEEPQPGLTNYTLTVFEKSETDPSSSKQIQEHNIEGWKKNKYMVGNLSSYWDYKFMLSATTSAGTSQPVNISYIRTKQSAPMAAEDVYIITVPNNYTALIIIYKCPKQKDGRNGVIVSSNLQYQSVQTKIQNPKTDDLIIQPNSNCEFKSTVTISPEVNYTFSVRLKTISFGSEISKNIYTLPGPPILNIQSIITHPHKATLFKNRFAMHICPICLYKPTTGIVTLAGIIVYKEDVYDAVGRHRRDIHNEDYYNAYTNWYTSSLTGFELPYKATQKNWISQESSTVEYHIGFMDCENEKKTFCNGPLPSGGNYIVLTFACTDGGCQESEGIKFVTEAESAADSGVDDSVIAVSVVAGVVFVLLLICAVIFFWYVRRHRKKSATESDFTNTNRQIHQEDGLYEIVDGQSRDSRVQSDVTHREVTSRDNGYVNYPQSHEQSDAHGRLSERFREGGYVNDGQEIHMNVYEKLDTSTTPLDAYEKLTSI